ncbi:MAG: hypothetical protein Q7T03_06185 [Deltaproteobacteria bacterium]|nr:hypothetical protein [Deltaproteobacteria bacterium]
MATIILPMPLGIASLGISSLPTPSGVADVVDASPSIRDEFVMVNGGGAIAKSSRPFIPTLRQEHLLAILAGQSSLFREALGKILISFANRGWEANLRHISEEKFATDARTLCAQLNGNGIKLPALEREFRNFIPLFKQCVDEFVSGEVVWRADEIYEAYSKWSDRVGEVRGSSYAKGREIGRYLQLLEQSRGFVPEKVAKALGIELSLYLNYRKGETRIPDALIPKVVAFFEIDEAGFRRFLTERNASIRIARPEGMPVILKNAKPHARALAEFLKNIIIERSDCSVPAFIATAKVKRSGVYRLLCGEVIKPGDRSYTGFESGAETYISLQKYLEALHSSLAKEFERLVRAAYLETKGWGSRVDWFATHIGLQAFFVEGRRQTILEQSQNEFKAVEALGPKGRFIWRVVDWWLKYNYASDSFSGSDLQNLIGMGRMGLLQTVAGEPPFRDMDAIKEMASKMSDPLLLKDWIDWRREELQKEFEVKIHSGEIRFVSARERQAMTSICHLVFEKWARFNGGLLTADFRDISVAEFGLGKQAFLDLVRRGRLPVRRAYVASLARTVEGLPEEFLDRDSQILKQWRLIHG